MFNSETLSQQELDLILSVLHAGGVIGFPTDSSYGLGADPFNEQAVATIFRIKGRPETKPILLLVDSVEMTERVAMPTPLFHTTARAFWPGPLTMVIPALRTLPEGVTAGSGTVGVRWPAVHFATELVRRFGGPVTATSANRAGMPACFTAEGLMAEFGDSVPVVVDGGALPSRRGSTIIDLTTDPPALLREGPISFEALAAFFGGNIRRAMP